MSLLTILITFILSTFFGHWTHWALHQKWMGKAHNAHMTHHLKMYPPENLFSETYRSAGKDNSVLLFIPFAIVLLILTFCCFYSLGFNPLRYVEVVLTMIFSGWLHDYIHEKMHIINHWLFKFEFMKKLRDLHMIHHRNMDMNYGIFTFVWDKLFSSFKK